MYHEPLDVLSWNCAQTFTVLRSWIVLSLRGVSTKIVLLFFPTGFSQQDQRPRKIKQMNPLTYQKCDGHYTTFIISPWIMKSLWPAFVANKQIKMFSFRKYYSQIRDFFGGVEVLELNLEPGSFGGNARGGTKFIKRFLQWKGAFVTQLLVEVLISS